VDSFEGLEKKNKNPRIQGKQNSSRLAPKKESKQIKNGDGDRGSGITGVSFLSSRTGQMKKIKTPIVGKTKEQQTRYQQQLALFWLANGTKMTQKRREETNHVPRLRKVQPKARTAETPPFRTAKGSKTNT